MSRIVSGIRHNGKKFLINNNLDYSNFSDHRKLSNTLLNGKYFNSNIYNIINEQPLWQADGTTSFSCELNENLVKEQKLYSNQEDANMNIVETTTAMLDSKGITTRFQLQNSKRPCKSESHCSPVREIINVDNRCSDEMKLRDQLSPGQYFPIPSCDCNRFCNRKQHIHNNLRSSGNAF